MAVLQERLFPKPEPISAKTAEQTIRADAPPGAPQGNPNWPH